MYLTTFLVLIDASVIIWPPELDFYRATKTAPYFHQFRSLELETSFVVLYTTVVLFVIWQKMIKLKYNQ